MPSWFANCSHSWLHLNSTSSTNDAYSTVTDTVSQNCWPDDFVFGADRVLFQSRRKEAKILRSRRDRVQAGAVSRSDHLVQPRAGNRSQVYGRAFPIGSMLRKAEQLARRGSGAAAHHRTPADALVRADRSRADHAGSRESRRKRKIEQLRFCRAIPEISKRKCCWRTPMLRSATQSPR